MELAFQSPLPLSLPDLFTFTYTNKYNHSFSTKNPYTHTQVYSQIDNPCNNLQRAHTKLFLSPTTKFLGTPFRIHTCLIGSRSLSLSLPPLKDPFEPFKLRFFGLFLSSIFLLLSQGVSHRDKHAKRRRQRKVTVIDDQNKIVWTKIEGEKWKHEKALENV